MQTRHIIMILALIIVLLSLVGYAAVDRDQDSALSQPLAKVIDLVAYQAPEAPDPGTDTAVAKPEALILTPGMTSEEIFAERDRAYQSRMSAEEIEARKNPQAGDIFTMRYGGTCTIVEHYRPNKDGTTSRLISCEPNQPRERRPHEQYDNATLEGMAYADAGAAYELGRRMVEKDPLKAREMMLRSAALNPENLHGLNWLVTGYYSAITLRNGKPAKNAMTTKYILYKVAEQLGAPDRTLSITKSLRAAGFNDQGFARLDAIANKELLKIRDVQLEVTGQTTVTSL